jgi:hypothetical protein
MRLGSFPHAWNNGMIEIRFLPNGLESNFSFLSCYFNLSFPTSHSVNFPQPIILRAASLAQSHRFAAVPGFQCSIIPTFQSHDLEAFRPRDLSTSPSAMSRSTMRLSTGSGPNGSSRVAQGRGALDRWGRSPSVHLKEGQLAHITVVYVKGKYE